MRDVKYNFMPLSKTPKTKVYEHPILMTDSSFCNHKKRALGLNPDSFNFVSFAQSLETQDLMEKGKFPIRQRKRKAAFQ
jgi:hypothetical protein